MKWALCLACLTIAPIGAAHGAGGRDFEAWRAALWPEAQAFGIRRAVYERELAGIVPDRTLPDLDIKRGPRKPRGQAEFTKPPQNYVNERYIADLARRGRRLLARHRKLLSRIEKLFGVQAEVVLAIWGRETAYGGHRLRHDAIRVLATQAYLGRRADMFRRELLYALRMLQDGVIERKRFRSSWAGAFGLTQFMPSEYDALAVDIDGDGRKDIWSVGDALASAANQLSAKGWLAGQTWGYEVVTGRQVTCAEDGPKRMHPIRNWQARGVKRVAGRRFRTAVRDLPAFLFSPSGGNGPQFLATENFLVFKRYNMSDLYALFVGHLADRIAGGGRFVAGWGGIKQLPSRQIRAIQSFLQETGFDISKIDGRIGPNTRSAIGAYQLKERITVDCWPSARLLAYMRKRHAQVGRN